MWVYEFQARQYNIVRPCLQKGRGEAKRNTTKTIENMERCIGKKLDLQILKKEDYWKGGNEEDRGQMALLNSDLMPGSRGRTDASSHTES